MTSISIQENKMRHRMLAIIFLLNIVLSGQWVQASEMTHNEVTSWLTNPKVQSSVEQNLSISFARPSSRNPNLSGWYAYA